MRNQLTVALIFILLAAGVFGQVRSHSFIEIDDLIYIKDNPNVQGGISLTFLKWAFTTFHATNWHPLTWISHAADYALWGDNPAGHHLTGVAIHLLNAFLLFLWLHRFTGSLFKSALVAAIFLAHPLRAESVAWAAERKDVLAGLFWMATLIAHGHYARRPSVPRYLAVVAALSLGLMAKPMVVSLPLILLLADHWPLSRMEVVGAIVDGPYAMPRRRLSWLVVEKFPLFLLCAASCAVTMIAQRDAGSIYNFSTTPLDVRLINAMQSYYGYIHKMLWPANLAFFYPYSDVVYRIWQVTLMASGLIGISAVSIFFWRRRPALFTGWFWYLIALIPVIGVVQVGRQAMADRYTYLPGIGFSIALVWLLDGLVERRLWWRRILAGAGIAAVLTLAVAAHRQVSHWRDSESLYRHALAVTSNNYWAHYNLASLLNERGLTDEAVVHYLETIRIKPQAYPAAYLSLAAIFEQRRQLHMAIGFTEELVSFRPGDWQAHKTLGYLYYTSQNLPKSIEHYRRAVEIRPDYASGHNNLANVLVESGDPARAAVHYREAIRLDPAHLLAHVNFATLLARAGKLAEAEQLFETATQIDPAYAPARESLDRVRSIKAKN